MAQRMKLGPGLLGSNSGYYPQTGQSVYSGVRRDVCASLDSCLISSWACAPVKGLQSSSTITKDEDSLRRRGLQARTVGTGGD